MNIIILGAAGFIGTNIAIELSKDSNNEITLVDRDMSFFNIIKTLNISHARYLQCDFMSESLFDDLLEGQEIVYHLVSTTVPTTSNQHVSEELKSNIIFSVNLLEACVRQKIKKVIFLSSGGTVYGKKIKCPISEKTPTNPISSYGVQKVTIEKLLYLYNYMYGLDYRIIRLANPYGPYQRPNGVLGAVTTFTYKALKGEEIIVYGDGTVVRDFIFIDDAIRAIQNIVNGNDEHLTFNLGCGYGTSINKVIYTIENTLDVNVKVKYIDARKVDVPVNYLDIGRYERAYGPLKPISLAEGVNRTASFMKSFYSL